MKTANRWWGLLALMAFAGGAWAQADEARAQKIVSGVCFLCHGAQGESGSEVFPRLAGQHWQYVAKQLENFKSGQRKSTAMADMVAKNLFFLGGRRRAWPSSSMIRPRPSL